MNLKDYSVHTKGDGLTANAANGRIAGLLRDYRARRSAIAEDPMIPAESKPSLQTDEQAAAAKALDSLNTRIKAAFAARKAKLRAKAQDAFYSGTSAADVARQEVAARRIRSLLDAGISAADVAQDAASRGDTLALHVLENELPVYEWEKNGQRPDPAEIEALVGPAKKEAGDDAYNSAVEALEETEAQEYQALVNAAQARGEVERGDEAVFVGSDAAEE